MANIQNLKRQHKDIINIIKIIKNLISNNNFETNSNDIAKNVNVLAGKLKIHLNNEDKFLYPRLLNHNNSKIKNKANEYIDEIGNLAEVFTNYKNQFNTKNKIMNNLDGFIKKSEDILNSIEKRINKEDSDLYLLVEKESLF